MWEDEAIQQRCNTESVGETERMVLCSYCGHEYSDSQTVEVDDGVMCKRCLAGEVPIRIHTTRERYERAISDND